MNETILKKNDERTENQYIRSWRMLVPLIQATHTHSIYASTG